MTDSSFSPYVNNPDDEPGIRDPLAYDDPDLIPVEPATAAEPPPDSDQISATPRRMRPRVRRVDVLFWALFIAILAVGGWLRFDHLNWDDYTHLHPDERFLTDVVTQLGGPLQFTDDTQAERDAHAALCAQRYPGTVGSDGLLSMYDVGQGGYFDADCSSLNPNNIGKGMYVYGEFPLFTVHAAGVARTQLSRDYDALLQAFDPAAAEKHTISTQWEGYGGAQLIGRGVSALADWLTIVVLFFLGRRLYGRWPGLLAAGLYAVTAFAIQQSHFFTVDAFTTFWVTLALYFAVRAMDGAGAQQGPRPMVYILIGFGGAVWDTGYRGAPILGLLSLGGLTLVMLALTAGLRGLWRWSGRNGGDLLVGASGVLAAIVYLVAWGAIGLAAPHRLTIAGDLFNQGLVALVFALAALVAFAAAGAIRRHVLGWAASLSNTLAIGAIGVMWVALMAGYALGGLSPWATVFVALSAVALLIFDATDLTDYALFGVALGAAVASRINMAPLAGVIVLAAGLRVLPALDVALHRTQRTRIVAYAITGVITAGVMSFIVFRLLQPHAFAGPGLFGLKFNPGWRDDMSQAAYLTSGDWDAPPNHQWEGRIPYLFPWRNIVEWGTGIPLGLLAWGAWVWASVAIARGRRKWTRHVIPFAWILVAFGWMAGRWVTTMRYFLPIYPPLILFGAWALWAMWVDSARWRAERRASTRGPVTTGRTATVVAVGVRRCGGARDHRGWLHDLLWVRLSYHRAHTIDARCGVALVPGDGPRRFRDLGRRDRRQPPDGQHWADLRRAAARRISPGAGRKR